MKDILQTVVEKLIELHWLDENDADGITSFDDPVLVAAVKTFEESDPSVAAKKFEQSGEPLIPNGRIGPAGYEVLTSKIHCGCPHTAPADWSEPAVGSGNHRGCHGVEGFHTSLYLVDSRGRPSWMPPEMWREILRRSQAHGDEMGWHHIHVDMQTHENLATGEKVDVRAESVEGTLLFEILTGSTIGLAHVPEPGQPCGSDWVWAKVDPGYHPKNPLVEFVTLVDHEKYGHNGSMRFGGNAHVPASMGRSIMSSSIQSGMNGWKNDPAWSVASKLYGGVKHPGWGTVMPEPPPPGPPSTFPGVGERLSSSFDYHLPDGKRVNAAIVRLMDKPGQGP